MSLWRRVLSERRALVVPLLTALVINVLVFALAVVPLSRSVRGDEQRAEEVKRSLIDAHRLARIATDTKASQVQAGEELRKFYAEVLPSNLAEARSLLYVEIGNLARETGLKHSTSVFTRDKEEIQQVENSSLVRYGIDVSLSGGYAGVRRFLYHLETSEQFFVVESVKLGSSAMEAGGTLDIVLRIATYFSRTAAPGAGQ